MGAAHMCLGCILLLAGIGAGIAAPGARADTIVDVPSPLRQTIDAKVDLVNTNLSNMYFDVAGAVQAATGSGDLSGL